jgi:hypothetical protein
MKKRTQGLWYPELSPPTRLALLILEPGWG